MEKIATRIIRNRMKIALFILIVIFIVIIIMLIKKTTATDNNNPQVPTVIRKSSDLIDFKEIASLSVSEFIYNGIGQSRDSSGNVRFNVQYESTVKVSVDAGKIKYYVDDEQKKVVFTFPDFIIEKPIIKESSIIVISESNSYPMEEIIACCRNDAANEINNNKKLIPLAKENLQSIVEAWYSSLFDGYTFEYEFGTVESGEKT